MEGSGARILSSPMAGWDATVGETLSGGLSSGPAVVNGAVYVAGNDGVLTCWAIPGYQPS